MSNNQSSGKKSIGLPSDKTLQQAVKISIKTAKPICFYFYVDSLKGNCSICSDGEDKIIFKNSEEHTSPILHTYKCDGEYIVITDNTVYILSSGTRVS